MVLKKEGEEGASLLFLKIGFDCVAGAFNLLASAAAPHYVWETTGSAQWRTSSTSEPQ